MACNCNPPRFHSMNCSVRETLCRGDLFHYGALLPPPLPIIVHSVLFHSAALIMLRLFAGACRRSLSLSLFFLPPSNHSQRQQCCPELMTWRKKREINNAPHLPNERRRKMCSKSAANNVQSKIIKLPVWQWLIFTNIWQDRFFFCAMSLFWLQILMPVRAPHKCLSSQTLCKHR